MRTLLPSGTPVEIARRGQASGAALVIAPDLFGLRPLFDGMATRLADEWGVAVAAVEPFPGRDLGPDPEPRMAAVSSLRDEDHLRDLVEAADLLGPERAVLIGFCMGGMYTLKAARSDRFDRLCAFYGMIRVPPAWEGEGQGQPLDLLAGAPADRLMAIVGTADPYTPPEDVERLEATGATVVRYEGAEHGFVHDPARPAHRSEDAADAWARCRAWLGV
jgi:carboxymethylenebutenolidase